MFRPNHSRHIPRRILPQPRHSCKEAIDFRDHAHVPASYSRLYSHPQSAPFVVLSTSVTYRPGSLDHNAGTELSEFPRTLNVSKCLRSRTASPSASLRRELEIIRPFYLLPALIDTSSLPERNAAQWRQSNEMCRCIEFFDSDLYHTCKRMLGGALSLGSLTQFGASLSVALRKSKEAVPNTCFLLRPRASLQCGSFQAPRAIRRSPTHSVSNEAQKSSMLCALAD